MLYCPECETSLDVEEDEVDEGEVLSCPECGMDFEVTTVNPVDKPHRIFICNRTLPRNSWRFLRARRLETECEQIWSN